MAKGGGGTTTQTSEPWKGQKPYLEQGFAEAQNLYNSSNPQYYNFSTTIPYSAQTQQALGQQEQIANQGMPGLGGAQNWLGGLYNGGGQNPYLDKTFDQAAGALGRNFRDVVNPQIQGYWEGIGGSPMNPGMLQQTQGALQSQYTKPMQDLATQIYGGAYENDQNRRMQGLGQIPGLYQASLAPSQTLGQVGAAHEAKSLEELQAQMAQFEFNQNKPADKLNQFLQQVGGGNWGGTSTTTGPDQSSNMWGDIASTAGTLGMMAPKAFGI